MLVLARKRNEQIVIGDNIIMTVLFIKGETTLITIEGGQGEERTFELHKGMSLFINNRSIKVMVLDFPEDKVEFGLTAPSHIPIYRREVYERILTEGQKQKKGGK